MDLKIKLTTASINRLFGLFALLQIFLFSLMPMSAFAQKSTSDNKFHCISKHVLTEADITAFVSLSTELQPSVFINQGRVNSFSATPVCLFADTISLAHLPAGLYLSDIELVQIKFTKSEQLQTAINLSVLASFPKLKYIHILSEIDTPTAAVREILTNVPPNAIVILTIDKPS